MVEDEQEFRVFTLVEARSLAMSVSLSAKPSASHAADTENQSRPLALTFSFGLTI